MITYLSKHWWMLLLRGIIAVLFGLFAWAMPSITLAALVLLFGVYAVADGVLAIAHSFSSAGQQHRWSLLFLGILGCCAGVVALGWPKITALSLLFVIAVWAIGTGILEIGAAFGLPSETPHRWLLGVAGAASTLFGVLLVVRPDAGLATIVWLLGFYGIVYGVTSIVASFKLRDLPDRIYRTLTPAHGTAA